MWKSLFFYLLSASLGVPQGGLRLETWSSKQQAKNGVVLFPFPFSVSVVPAFSVFQLPDLNYQTLIRYDNYYNVLYMEAVLLLKI